jgi:hypothetical protein
VYRYVEQLIKRGYVQKKEDKFIIPLGFDPLSPPKADPIPEQDIKFFEEFLSRFEKGLDATLDKQDMYYKILSERLNQFSPNEMMKALENRISFVSGSEWHQKEQNRPNATDIMLLIRDNETLLKWLNMKSEKNPVELKPIKFT